MAREVLLHLKPSKIENITAFFDSCKQDLDDRKLNESSVVKLISNLNQYAGDYIWTNQEKGGLLTLQKKVWIPAKIDAEVWGNIYFPTYKTEVKIGSQAGKTNFSISLDLTDKTHYMTAGYIKGFFGFSGKLRTDKGYSLRDDSGLRTLILS